MKKILTSKSIVFYYPIIFHFFLIVENKLIDKVYEFDDKVTDANQVKDDVFYNHNKILFHINFTFLQCYSSHLRIQCKIAPANAVQTIHLYI